ncbi:MAG: universal stress protein [Rhodobacteraceae bacterium]|nr:universal stress protein [Paracoccaceae bacterium]
MAFKSFVVFATDLDGDAGAIQSALALARKQSAHLDIYCLGIEPAHYDVMAAGTGAVLLQRASSEAQSRAQALTEKVEELLSNDDPRVAVLPVVAPQQGLENAVARRGRYGEMAVAMRPYGDGGNSLAVDVVEAELFGAGIPVLILPGPEPIADNAPDSSRVMIAWNESDEALAAVRRALPLLKTAGHVDIVMVDPPSHSPERSDPGGGLCMMLSRQGVSCEVSILARTMPRISDVLIRFARDRGTDAVIMGAYGHSRIREALLGGVTREMLESAEIPVFMAR